MKVTVETCYGGHLLLSAMCKCIDNFNSPEGWIPETVLAKGPVWRSELRHLELSLWLYSHETGERTHVWASVGISSDSIEEVCQALPEAFDAADAFLDRRMAIEE